MIGSPAEAVVYTPSFSLIEYNLDIPLDLPPVETVVDKPVENLGVTYYCVTYLREVRGLNVRGDAYTIQPNTPLRYARRGDIILLEYGDVSHASEIIGFINGEPVVIEANFKRGQVTQRLLTLSKERVRGIYRPKEKAA